MIMVFSKVAPGRLVDELDLVLPDFHGIVVLPQLLLHGFPFT
jgi:hypothetical protein